MKQVVAVIVAAGEGVRMGEGPRKQYRYLDKFPVLTHTLFAFDKNPEVNDIVLVLPAPDIPFCWEKIIAPLDFQKRIRLVSGGVTRQESVYNGLRAIEKNDCNIVVIHDSVRPLVSSRLITRSVAGAQEYGACIAAIPAKDTLKIVKNDTIQQTISRDRVWMAQTPQAFRYDFIMKAHEAARKEQFKGTDDAALIERLGMQVHVIKGDPRNIKITTPGDLKVAEAILNTNN
jgi:2-C-methyl-D-erythritol 4-phosphate cytidylyltransferase